MKENTRSRWVRAGGRRPLAVLIGAVVLGGTACAGAGGGPATGEGDTPAPGVPATAGAGAGAGDQVTSVSPIVDFMSAGKGERSLAFRVDHAVADCMHEKGWEWQAHPAVDVAEEPTEPVALGEWRRTYGYGQLSRPPSVTVSDGREVDDRNVAYRSTLSADDRRRFDADLGVGLDNESGLPPSGCRGDAEKRYRDRYPVANERIVKELGVDGYNSTRAHPDYLEAQSRWSACMARAGYAINRPKDAPAEFARAAVAGNVTEELKARERAVATADTTCSRDTVWPVQARLEAELVRRTIDRYGREATCGPDCG
jgi:hypothetical protein